MGIKKIFISVVSLLVALAIVFPVASQAALSGLDIMKKVDELPQGDDQKSTVTLRLISAQGQERKIVTSRYWKNYRGKNGFYSKTLFFTDFPPDVKNTGFLIWDSGDWMRMSINSSGRNRVIKTHATLLRVVQKRKGLHTVNAYSGY